METMYDRLGDLLNETLEAGHVKYVYVEGEDEKKSSQENNSDPHEKTADKSESFSENGGNEAVNKEAESNERQNVPPKQKKNRVIKKITPEIQRAYRLFDISISATKDDVKKAYKEKLKYYHPDKYQHNAVLTKIATDKTRQVVEAYALILDFLEK